MTPPRRRDALGRRVAPAIERVESNHDPKVAISEHLGLLITGGITLAVVWRLLAVSRYDVTTAMGVLQTAGTTNVAVGGFVASLPTLIGIAAYPAYQRFRRWIAPRSSVERSAAGMLMSPFAVVVVALVPVFLVLVAMTAGVLLHLLRWLLRKRGTAPSTPRDRVSRFEAATVNIAVLLTALTTTLSLPWMPAESISVAGAKPFKGYVIGSREDQLVVLDEHDRGRLVVVDTTKTEHSYCADETWLSKSVFGLFARPRYPQCPSS